MPWEQRGRREYYYQPIRADGKPRRIYWGTGEVGRLHELLTARDQRLRAKRVAEARVRVEVVTTLRRDTRAAVTWVRQMVRAARLVAGEYQHRGQWRWRAGHRYAGQGRSGPAPAKVNCSTRPPRFSVPSPFTPVVTMTQPPASGPITPDELGRRLLELNNLANRGDRSALAELEELLDHHPVVWQTAARLAADTSTGWARLLGDGGPVAEACLRRELASWKAGLAGPDPTPLVTAAVDAAGVVWLAQRYAEREFLRSEDKKRATASRQLTAANRQFQEAIKLVIAARATAGAVANATAGGATTTSGPRLFGGVG